MLKLQEIWKYISLKETETGMSYGQNFGDVNKLGQNIWNKVNKSGTTGQRQKTLISVLG